MSSNKLHGGEAFIITEALKYYGKHMRKQIKSAEKQGLRPVFGENFFEMMGNDIAAKLPRLTYKEKPPRKY
jgi:hypothetical protein